MTVSTKQALNTPGDRLKYLRAALLRVSRAYLQERHGLPEVTLKSWENGTTNLTRSGAERCVEVYRHEGLVVNEDWILEGMGLDPKIAADVSHYFAIPTNKDLPFEDDEVAMVRDANIFKENYSNAVVMVVSNDDMRPYFWPGDYIGGKIRNGVDAIDSMVNKNCIVYLKNGERFFRRLIKNSSGNYNLTCLNPNETTSEPVLYDVEIDGAAPVIWHRRKDD